MNSEKRTYVPMVQGFLGAALFWAVAHSGPAIAQVQGSLPAFLKLQPTTPGSAQTGHANVTGTVTAGQFEGGGAGLTNVNATRLDGLDSTDFLQSVPVPLTLNSSSSTYILKGQNSSGSIGATALNGTSTSATGQTNGVYGTSASSTGNGVQGFASSTTGVNFGVTGRSSSSSGRGVYGGATSGTGTTFGGFFESDSTSGLGVYGLVNSNTGLVYGVQGFSTSSSGRGVAGFSASNISGIGVRGQANGVGGTGVFGVNTTVDADGTGASPYGVFGSCSTANALGYAVFAQGFLGATGFKSFRIDHPLDPENKYLYHYSSESPYPQNFYNGNVSTDGSGTATVALPPYFSSINKNFKYQLTVIDGSEDFVLAKVSKTISGNSFEIRTSKPNVQVSWRVEADRNDKCMQFTVATDEREKPSSERGTYQHPEYYGLPASRGTYYSVTGNEPGGQRNAGP